MEQEDRSQKSGKRIAFWVIALAGIAVLAGIALPGHGPLRNGYHAMSWTQMKQISLGIEQFRRDHHDQFPHRLSELAPEYIGSLNVFFFQSPYTTSFTPPYTAFPPELIDVFSAYIFEVLPDQRLLIAERPGLWKDGTMTYLLLDSKMEPVGTVKSCRVTPYEFELRFMRQFRE
jgi:hypothetical protein